MHGVLTVRGSGTILITIVYEAKLHHTCTCTCTCTCMCIAEEFMILEGQFRYAKIGMLVVDNSPRVSNHDTCTCIFGLYSKGS